jgi:autotransporter-associated beta strand protein
MAPFSWSRWLRSLSTPRAKSVRRPRRQPPRLEVLEDRLAPATYTWTGLGANQDWSNNNNWIIGGKKIAPQPNEFADLVFPSTAAQLLTHNDFPVFAGSEATFDSITFSGSNYIVTGNQLTLGDPSVTGSGSLIVTPLVKNVRINLPMQMAAPGSGRQFIDVGQSADLTINGQLSGTTGANLTKRSAGTLTLTADNSGFIGPITLDTNGGVTVITHANALGNGLNGAAVQANAQLQVKNVKGPIFESLILNGQGPDALGALVNVAGTNTWAGPIALDSDTTLGSTAGVLDIVGQISDLGAGHNIIKEGASEIIFAAANTYRGKTTINNGTLDIQNPLALGAADGTFATGTFVNVSNTKVGTLQIDDPTRVGFTVVNEMLVLAGPGVNNDGALLNKSGNNTWTGNVLLVGGPAIGVDEGTTLTVTGIVQGASGLVVNPTPFGFTKARQPDNGTLIFTSANTYSTPIPGTTDIVDGTLQIQDSKGLGGSICLVEDQGTLALAVDDLPDSVSGTTNTLWVSNPLIINGFGFARQGALDSKSGINTYAGPITLGGNASIGVQPDPNPTPNTTYFPTFNAAGDAVSGDYSLTVIGGLKATPFGGPHFVLSKLGTGQLILPTANNGLHLTDWDIVQGWVTIQNSNSLGALIPDRDQNLQPQATVEFGAALHLNPAAGAPSLDVGQNLVLAGQGISHPFGLINQQGALENLRGNNTVHGNIALGGQVGVGVEKVFGDPSQLISTASVSQKPPVLKVVAAGSTAENDNIIETGSTNGTVTVNYSMYYVPDSLDIYYGIFGQGGKLIASTGGPVSGTGTLTATYGPGASSVIEIIVNKGGGTVGAAWTYTATIIPTTVQPGGITKLGSQALILQGDGTYQGNVDIRQGLLIDQNNTGLGTGAGTTTVEAGASLALANGLASLNAGVQTGIQVWGEHLVLNGPGNTTLGTPLAPLTVLGDNTVTGPTDNIIATDDLWRGPVTLNTGAAVGVPANSRLILTGAIDDGSNPLPAGSALTKVGGGELVVSGANSYRGNTYVGAGPIADPAFSEVQQVEVYGTAGTFTLTFNGASTGPLTFGASAAAVQAALNGLPTIGGSGASVSVTQTGSFYVVVFGGSLTGVNVPQMTVTTTGGTLAVATTLSDGGTASAFFGNPGSAPGGVLTVANSQGLGATTGAVFVEQGASLQLQGHTTVAGKSLTVAGSGLINNPTPPPQTWFEQGPMPVTQSQTLAPQTTLSGNLAAASGRVTGVAVDPTDPQTIFLSTAGGGAWKTSNGGQTWLPLFDNGPNSPPMFAGAIAVDPANPLHVYLGTGEANNSTDSYYGTGVYESTDGGRNWKLLTGVTKWSKNPPTRIFSVPPTTPPTVVGVDRGTLLFNASTNPFYGLAISRITVGANGIIFVSTSDRAANHPALPPDSAASAGIWRYDPNPDSPAVPGGGVSDWFDMTNVPSDVRMGLLPMPNSGFPNTLGPGTPGPDDQWMITFPASNAVWSDAQLSSAGRLYVALGIPEGHPFNGVYRCDNPASPGSPDFFAPIWYIGDGNTYPFHNNYNAGGSGQYRTGVTRVPANANVKLTIDPTDPNLIYGVDTNPGLPDPQGILDIQQSTDFGRTWATIPNPPNVPSPFPFFAPNSPQNYQGTQGRYDSVIQQAPNHGPLYIAGEWAILETPDRGQNWIILTKDSAGNSPAADFHALALNTAANSLLAGTDGGLWSFDTTVGQPTSGLWTDLNTNLATALANSVATLPANPAGGFVSTQASGTDQFNNAQPWQMVDDASNDLVDYPPGPFGVAVAVDQNNPQNVYAWIQVSQMQPQLLPPLNETLAYLRKSTDGGKTWFNLPTEFTGILSGDQAPPLLIDPVNTNRILIGGVGSGLQQSLDGGLTWNDLLAPSDATAIAVASYIGGNNGNANDYDPSTVYIVGADDNVYVTNDLGTSWTPPRPLPGNRTPPMVRISDVEVDPRNRNTAYATSSAPTGTLFNGAPVPRVMMTTNAGLTWTNIAGAGSTGLPDIPVWKLVIDPRTGYLYVGTDKGVYWSSNGGTSWQALGSGIGNVQVKDLVLDEAVNTLSVASYGRSEYIMYLDETQANAGGIMAISGTGVWTGPIQLAGPTSIGAASTQAPTQPLQAGSNFAQLNILGVISDQTPGANNYLTKIGAGDVIFSGPNTYGGITEVKQGALVVNNPQALGGTANGTFVDAGQVLELETNLNGETVHLNGDGIAFNGHNTGALRNISNFNTFTGTLVLDTNSTVGVDSGSQLTIASPGTVTDNGNKHTLTKELTGTLALAGADSYGTGSAASPSTFVNQGALNVQNPAGLGLPGNLTQVLDGAQLQVSGNVTVPATYSLRISGGGINNTGALEGVGGVNDWQGPITLAQDPGFNPPTTPPNSVSIGALETNPADTLTIDGVIGQLAGTTMGLTKVGLGTVVLTNANTYGGLTNVAAGALRVENPLALGASGSAANGTVVQPGAAVELDGDPNGVGASLTVPSETLILNGTGAPTVQTVTVNGTTGSFTLTFNNQTTVALAYNASAAAVQAALNALSSVKGVGGSVSVLLETTAAGHVYTIVFVGSLTAADQPQLIAKGSGGTTAVVSTARHGATGALRNYVGNNTWAAPVLLRSSSDLGADPGTTMTISGQVQNETQPTGFAPVPAPSLVKVGAGTVVLSAANTYTGPTVVGQGILNVQNGQALGAVVNEIQQVTLGGPLTGFFKLTFNGQTTAALSSNTTLPSFATTVQNALNALSSIGGVGGGVHVNLIGNTSTFTVTFDVGTLAGHDQPQMTGTGFAGTTVNIITLQDGSSGTTVNAGGTLQIQGGTTVSTEDLTITGTGTSAVQEFTTAGPFKLTFNGQTTPTLPFGASFDQVAAALNALSSIGGVGGSVAVAVTNGIYTVTFGGSLAGIGLPTMTGTGIGPTVTINPGTGSPQQVVLTGPPGGGFVLSFNGATTIPLPVGASDVQVQSALAALPTIGSGNVTVTKSGNSYTVSFVNGLAGNTIPLTGAPVVLTVTPGGLGALDSPSGANTWDSSVTLVGNASIGADIDMSTGVPVVSTLTIDKTIGESGKPSNLTKVGGGNVMLSGSTSNTYTGLTTVAEGTLQLNKSGGAFAVGNVAVGDNQPSPLAPLSDVLQLLAPNQMPATAAVTINSDGLFDLNGQQQAVGSLTMAGGTVSITGLAAKLTLNGNVTASTDSFGNPATIVDVGTLSLGGQTRTFNVAGPVGLFADLVISAPVADTLSGANAEGIIKTGPGTLALTAVNPSFTGSTTISQGAVLADGDPAVGNTLAAVSLNGGTLGGNGSVGQVTATTKGGVLMGGDPFPITPGTLNITTVAGSPSVLNNATKFVVQLNTPADGPSSLITLTGPAGGTALNLGNAVLAAVLDPNIKIGNTFTIIQAVSGTITGRFQEKYGEEANTDGIAFLSGEKFDVHYTPTQVTLTRALENATVSLTSSANPSVFGQDPTFTATVTAEVGAGTVPDGDTVQFTLLQGTTVLLQKTIATVGQKAVFDPQAYGVYPLAVGSYTVQARFNADGSDTAFNFADAPPLSQQVNKASTTINLTDTPAPPVNPVPNQPVTVTATVLPVAPGAGVPAGTVSFTLDGNPAGTFTLSGGKASVVLTGLTASLHRVRASFTDSDGDFKDYSTPSDFLINVVKGNPTVTVTSAPPSSVFGQAVTFTVSLAGVPGLTPTGTVDFYDGATVLPNRLGGGKLVGGTFTVTTSALAVATHTINVTYSGDTSYNSASGSLTNFKVNPADTATTLTSSVNPSTYQQTVTLTASVAPKAPGAGTPAGAVNFFDGTTKIGSSTILNTGNALLFINSLTIGTHSLTATYVGNTNFNTSTSPILSQVVKVASVVTVTPSVNPSVFGQPVTFTAKVKAPAPLTNVPPDGETVNFYDGSAATGTLLGTRTLTGGVATLTTAGLSTTTHTITVTYAGDTVFVAGSGTLTQTVNRDATATTVQPFTPVPVYGQSLTFTASVVAKAPGAGTPTGTVNFYDGAVLPANLLGGSTLDNTGSTTFSPSTALAAGTHAIIAVYADDTNFAPSQGSTSQAVSKASTGTTITTNSSPTVFGQPAVFTVTVFPVFPGAGNPTGKVTFYDGPAGTGANLGTSTLSPGGGFSTATLTISTLSVGVHSNVNAVYVGDPNFIPSQTTTPASLEVDQDPTTQTVSSSLNPSVVGVAVTFTATVTANAPGSGVPGGTVTFLNNGVAFSPAVNLSGGKATYVTTSLPQGVDPITVSYSGNASYLGGTSSPPLQQTVFFADAVSVSSSLDPAIYGQAYTLTATVAPVGTTSVPTGKVDFLDGPITLAVLDLTTTGGVATAALTIPSTTPAVALLTGGTHFITVHYEGDTNFTPNNTPKPLGQVVTKDGSTTAVSVSTNSTIYGLPVTLTATVSPNLAGSLGTPGGSVTFWDGAVNTGGKLGTATLSGGQATLVVTTSLHSSTAGSLLHNINASYTPDSNYTGSSSTTPAQVTVFQSTTQTGLTSSLGSPPATAVYGQAVTFTAFVVPLSGGGVPAGTVKFYSGAAVPANLIGTATLDATGTATLVETTALAASATPYNVQAVYQGNQDYVGSPSDPYQLTINQDATNVAITASVSPSAYFQPVTFTASVAAAAPGSGIPTGMVTFLDGTTPLGTFKLVGGVAQMTISSLAVGDHQISVSYAGDTNFTGNTSPSFKHTVFAQTVNTLKPALPPKGVQATVPFALTVTAVDVNGLQVFADFDPVSISLAGGPPGGKLNGTPTASFKNGVAVLNNLVVTRSGTYTLKITGSGKTVFFSFTTTGRLV